MINDGYIMDFWNRTWMDENRKVLSKQEHVCTFARCIYRQALMDAGKIAAEFSIKPSRSLHPDIKWEDMKPEVQTAAHATAQLIALEIFEALKK